MNESQDSPPASSASEEASTRFFEHMEEAFARAVALKFEDAEFHVGQMKDKLGGFAVESDRLVGGDILTVTSGFVTGLKGLCAAKTPEDRQTALTHLREAKNVLRNLRANNADFAKNPGMLQMALGLEGQILGVQRQLARDRQDVEELKRLDAQVESNLEEMIKTTTPEDPLHWFLKACKLMAETMPRFMASIGAAGEMNLDLAQQYMREASASFETMKSHFTKAGTDVAMAQTATRMGTGFGLIAQALNSYINVLRDAIVGDVAKTDVDALAEAERNALDGATQVSKAAGATPGFFPGVEAIPSYAQSLATLIRNLRGLVERSLSPKAISRSASPRALIYFLVVFIVLLLALPISGLVQKVNFMEVGFLLVISAIISLISAFGFESIRLVPWFDTLLHFVPGASKAKKSELTAQVKS